jgi:hypothetical protein
VKLNKLHILQGNACLISQVNSITGVRETIGGGLVDFTKAAGSKERCLGLESVNLPGRDLVDDKTRDAMIRNDQIKEVEFLIDLDSFSERLQVEGVLHNPSGPVCRMAGPLDGPLPEVSRMPAKSPLRDRSVRGAIERNAHVFQFINRSGSISCQDFCGILISSHLL